jgi:hypothetical protein
MLLQVYHADHLRMAARAFNFADLVLLFAHPGVARVHCTGAALHLEQPVCFQAVKP